MRAICNFRRFQRSAGERRLCDAFERGGETSASAEAPEQPEFSAERRQREGIFRADKLAASFGAVADFAGHCAKFVSNFLRQFGKSADGVTMPAGAPSASPIQPIRNESEKIVLMNMIEKKQESEKLVLYNMIENPAAKAVTENLRIGITAAHSISADIPSPQRVNLSVAAPAQTISEPAAAREVAAERVRRGEMFLDSANFAKYADGMWSAPDTPWKFKSDGNGRWFARQTDAGQWTSVDFARAGEGDQRISTILQFLRQSSAMAPEQVQEIMRANKRQEAKREGGIWLLQNGCTPRTDAGESFEYKIGGFLTLNPNPQFRFVDGKWAVRWKTWMNWSDPSASRAPSGRGETAINAILAHLSSLNNQINEAGVLHARPSSDAAAGPNAVVNLVPSAPAVAQPEEPLNLKQLTERERQKETAASYIGILQNNTVIAVQQYAKDGSPGNLVNVIHAAREELTALRMSMSLMREEPEISKIMIERAGQIQAMLTEGKLVEHVASLAKRADDTLARARERVNEVIAREQQTIINENAARQSGGWFGGVHRAITSSNPYEISITNARMTISRMRPLIEQIDKATAQPDALAKIRAAETAFSSIRSANRSNARFEQEMYKLEQEAITVSRDVSIAVATTVATLGTSAAFSLAARGATVAAGSASSAGSTTILGMLRHGGTVLAVQAGKAALKELPSAIGKTIDDTRAKIQGGTSESGDIAAMSTNVANKVGTAAAFSPFGKLSGTVQQLKEKFLS